MKIEAVNHSEVLQQQPCLFDLNLKVEKGQLIGIIGPVGAGKSSLISTLLGEASFIFNSGL